MHNQLRHFALITAFAIGAAVCIAPASATPFAQDHDRDHRDQRNDQDHRDQRNNDHPDYSNNSYYRLGNREGLQDHRRNTQRTAHNHHYRSDDDRNAHDYGYQQGWQGQNYHNDRHDPQ